MRDFRKMKIWIDSTELVVLIYKLTARFPTQEKFGLTSQIQRAAVSIPSNVAEGSSRNSDIEFKRFLEIAMGSAFELETQLVLSNKLSYLTNEELSLPFERLNEIQRQINGLISKIKKDISS